MGKSSEKYGKLSINHSVYKTRLSNKFKNKPLYKPDDTRFVNSFIPGTITEVRVKVGDQVNEGDILLVLEAMKMKNRIKAPVDAIIKSVTVKVGVRVSKGQMLIELE